MEAGGGGGERRGLNCKYFCNRFIILRSLRLSKHYFHGYKILIALHDGNVRFPTWSYYNMSTSLSCTTNFSLDRLTKTLSQSFCNSGVRLCNIKTTGMLCGIEKTLLSIQPHEFFFYSIHRISRKILFNFALDKILRHSSGLLELFLGVAATTPSPLTSATPTLHSWWLMILS